MTTLPKWLLLLPPTIAAIFVLCLFVWCLIYLNGAEWRARFTRFWYQPLPDAMQAEMLRGLPKTRMGVRLRLIWKCMPIRERWRPIGNITYREFHALFDTTEDAK